jgi:periplasmic protein TonB
MAEPRRFQFDSNQRSIGTPARRRGVWLWIAVSLALHGAIVLFALVGAARGGHVELAGTFEVTVVGPPSAGEPDGGAKTEKSDAPPGTDAAPRRPEAPPEKTPSPLLPRPSQAPPPAAAPSNVPPPADAPKLTAKPQPAAAPDPVALPRKVTPAEAEPSEPRPDMTAPAPKRPDVARPPEPMAPPRESTPAEAAPPVPRPTTAEAAPKRPEAPASPTTPTTPTTPTLARPKAAREPAATPKATANAAPRGVKKAPEGQTASLGSPNGGERLGRSDSDDTGGMLNINLNPRFRSPPPPPVYPRQSIERDEEGVVLVRALVDPVGAPQRVLVFKSSGFPLLDEAALVAVQKWRFEPMIREGRAAAAWVQVPVRFRLN